MDVGGAASWTWYAFAGVSSTRLDDERSSRMLGMQDAVQSVPTVLCMP